MQTVGNLVTQRYQIRVFRNLVDNLTSYSSETVKNRTNVYLAFFIRTDLCQKFPQSALFLTTRSVYVCPYEFAYVPFIYKA